MHSSTLLYTVLLASTMQDIDCLPTPPLSQLTPHAKNAASKAVPHLKNALNLGKGQGRTMSSYKGPLIPETDKEAIAIVDVKGDDNMALNHLRRTGHYSQVHAVVSGVNNMEAAHGSLKDYHAQMTKARWEKEHSGPWMQSTLKVYKGGENPMQKAAPHEHFFNGKPEPIENHMNDLSRHFHPETKKIDVFHLAPAKHEDLQKIYDQVHYSGRKVDINHTTVGYNNNQGPEHLSNGEAEKKHLQDFHKLPHNDDASTYLIQSKTSFGDSSGGTQPHDRASVRNPPNAMKPLTTHEPFHFGQMAHADGVIAAHNEKHKGNAAKQVKTPDPVPGKDAKEQQANMWAGRLKADEHGKKMATTLINHAEQRQEALKKIQEHDKDADHSNALRRLDAAKDGWKKPCEVETCDMNHVALVVDAHHKYPEKFVNAVATSGRDVAPAKKGDPIHGKTLLNQTRDHARHLSESSFPPIFDEKKAKGDH